MRIGAHISSRGDFAAALDTARDLGCNCAQFFTRNPRGGSQRTVSDEEAAAHKQKRRDTGFGPVVMHVPYVVNLASDKEQLRSFASRVIAEDLERCRLLGAEYLVLHPGKHVQQGRAHGVRLIAEGLGRAMASARDSLEAGVMVLLELMSGAGTEIGELEDLASVVDSLDYSDSVGVCLDTCHVFADGWDVRTTDGLDRLLTRIDQVLGLERLRVVHLNDSIHHLGSHKDRHALLGEGEIGREGISAILRSPRLRDAPFILEVPVEKQEDYAGQIDLARRLRRGNND